MAGGNLAEPQGARVNGVTCGPDLFVTDLRPYVNTWFPAALQQLDRSQPTPQIADLDINKLIIDDLASSNNTLAENGETAELPFFLTCGSPIDEKFGIAATVTVGEQTTIEFSRDGEEAREPILAESSLEIAGPANEKFLRYVFKFSGNAGEIIVATKDSDDYFRSAVGRMRFSDSSYPFALTCELETEE